MLGHIYFFLKCFFVLLLRTVGVCESFRIPSKTKSGGVVSEYTRVQKCSAVNGIAYRVSVDSKQVSRLAATIVSDDEICAVLAIQKMTVCITFTKKLSFIRYFYCL